ncbi:MAG: 4'-phosphopantetheinyl transferase superfamily protein [Chitinispirillales bacterium]|jgi:4'-phosphopantetheinyl transferase|nr:4'-phosphopantetheinyl transferase superfamily protein [Chitinispirillales bacterium]
MKTETVRIYVSDIRDFMGLDGIGLVTDARRKRIDRFIKTEDKARCLAAGLLLRLICGVTDESHLTYGNHGRPRLKNGNGYFNISHSGNYAILATADDEVGVDIEVIAPYDEAVINRCFTPEECEWMRREENDEAFFRLWTAKESIMKATGLGFSLPPESFSVLPIDASEHRIVGKSWFLDWMIYDGHVICRAVEGVSIETEMITVSSSGLIDGKKHF